MLVFISTCRLSLVGTNRGYSSFQCSGFSLWLLLLWNMSYGHMDRLSSYSTQALEYMGFSSCGLQALEHGLTRAFSLTFYIYSNCWLVCTIAILLIVFWIFCLSCCVCLFVFSSFVLLPCDLITTFSVVFGNLFSLSHIYFRFLVCEWLF